MTKEARLTAVVRGRVQGVFFRYFVQQAANERGLVGWAYNRADGRSVEVVAEGSRPDLEALLQRLYVGPPGAMVETVESSWAPAQGGLHGFRVG